MFFSAFSSMAVLFVAHSYPHTKQQQVNLPNHDSSHLPCNSLRLHTLIIFDNLILCTWVVYNR